MLHLLITMMTVMVVVGIITDLEEAVSRDPRQTISHRTSLKQSKKMGKTHIIDPQEVRRVNIIDVEERDTGCIPFVC